MPAENFAQEVIDFWLVETAPEKRFEKDPAFDRQIKARFGSVIEAALAGELDGTVPDVTGALGLILVLDQFTRNVFRDTPKAFAGDPRALKLSQDCAAKGYLAHPDQDWRQFMLMPMMHCEDIAVQKASLPLFQAYASEETHRYAVMHHDIIARFGRYPHRNAILGRESTPEELEFLSRPGSSF